MATCPAPYLQGLSPRVLAVQLIGARSHDGTGLRHEQLEVLQHVELGHPPNGQQRGARVWGTGQGRIKDWNIENGKLENPAPDSPRKQDSSFSISRAISDRPNVCENGCNTR